MTIDITPAVDSVPLEKQRIESVLVALRRVMRATDLHSRQLVKTTGLTAPQMLLLQAIRKHGNMIIGELAAEMSLSHATVTTIVDRLESRGLIARVRCSDDRRRIRLELKEAALDLLRDAPIPLQAHFVEQFSSLDETEQELLIASLQKVARMMDAEAIDASPVLDAGLLDGQEAGF